MGSARSWKPYGSYRRSTPTTASPAFARRSVTRPDTTPPVVVPPAEPNVPTTPAPDQDTMNSLDGSPIPEA